MITSPFEPGWPATAWQTAPAKLATIEHALTDLTAGLAELARLTARLAFEHALAAAPLLQGHGHPLG